MMNKKRVFALLMAFLLLLGPFSMAVSASMDTLDDIPGGYDTIDGDAAADENSIPEAEVTADGEAGACEYPAADDNVNTDAELNDDGIACDSTTPDTGTNDTNDANVGNDDVYAGAVAAIGLYEAISAFSIPTGYDVHVGDLYAESIPAFSSLRPGEVWTGKSVEYPYVIPGNPASGYAGTAVVTLYVWGRSYTNEAGVPNLLLGGDQLLTISASPGDFQVQSASLPYIMVGGYMVWTIPETAIMNTAEPFSITYTLYLDEDPNWRTDFWYTTAGSRVEVQFTPGSDNPFYWTKEEIQYNAFTINSMSWNNGNGITGGTITDHILGLTVSFGSNTSDPGKTAVQASPGEWINNAQIGGVSYYWHLEWVKNETNRTYVFTIRNFDTDLDGHSRDLVYVVQVTGQGGNISGVPGGRIITSDHYFRRTFEAGTDYQFEWGPDGSLIYRTDVVARVMLTEIPPPSGTLRVAKELDGLWYDSADWNLTQTSIFQAILTNDDGEFVMLTHRADLSTTTRVYEFAGTSRSPLLATLFQFSVAVPAEIRDLPVDSYFIEERFNHLYDQRTLDLIERYGLITTTISLGGGSFSDLDTTSVTIVENLTTEVIVRNHYAHGIGFLEVFKVLDGFPRDWGIGADDVFYVRIWDVEAENYLLFWDNPAYSSPGAVEFWCVGNHALGLTDFYPGYMIPTLEIPISVSQFARLSNLWTWGAYEVREVRRVDGTEALATAAWDDFWLTADRDPVWITGGNAWNPAFINDIWLGGSWNPAWLTNETSWTAQPGPYWEYVRPIVNDPAWHADKNWNWGVLYSEGNGTDTLHLGETVTVTVTNRYQFHGGTIVLSKDLCVNADGWGMDSGTSFYASLWADDGDLVVFVPDGVDTFRVVGFIHNPGTASAVYTVLCPVGSPVPPANALTQIPFTGTPIQLIEVPSYPYGTSLYYTITEVFPGGVPDGFDDREYLIVTGSTETPVLPGGFLVPNESTTYLTIRNSFVPAFFVTYDGNGNTGGTEPVDGPREAGETVTVLGRNDLSRDGWSFLGWHTDSNADTPLYVAGNTFTMPAENVTLYAIWMPVPPDLYTVTYHRTVNVTGTAPVDAASPYQANDTVTVLGQGTLDRPGYRFMGWYRPAPGGGSGTSYAPGDTFLMPAHNVRLYAMWQVAYTVTYDGNGHTGGTEPVDLYRYLGTGSETVTVLGQGDLTRDGWTFLGWHTDSNATAALYIAGNTFSMPATNVTLFAIWEQNPPLTYTVTYHGNGHTGGTAPLDTELYEASDTVDVQHPGTLVRTGYRFMGWSTNRGGYGALTWFYPDGLFEMPARNIRFYAQWAREFTVTYHGNGHTAGIPPVQEHFIAGETVTVQSHGNLARTGHTFQHWNTEADNSGNSHHADGPAAVMLTLAPLKLQTPDTFAILPASVHPSTFTMPAEDVNLHAQWQPQQPPSQPPTPSPSPSPSPTPRPPGTPGNFFVEEHIWYVRGDPRTNMRPNADITRAEVAMVFYRLLLPELKDFMPESPFVDVRSNAWYGLGVGILAHHGILTGYPNGEFRPNEPVTRREMAAIVSRFDHLLETDENPYTDLNPNDWAYGYILSATAKGWFIGYGDGMFRPGNNLTRAEFVTAVNRVLNRHILPEDIPEGVFNFPDLDASHWAYAAFMEAAHTHEYERRADGINEIWTRIIENGLDAPYNQ